MGYDNSTLPSHHSQSTQSTYYDQHHYSLPPLQSTAPSNYSYSSQHSSSSPSYSNYSTSAWNGQPTHPAVQSLRNSNYWSHGPSAYSQTQGSPPVLSLTPPASQPRDDYRPISPADYSSYSPTSPNSIKEDILIAVSPTSTDVVPPPRRRISPGSREHSKAHGTDIKEGVRGPGNRPAGVERCSSCKATTSPEWRKGPSGKKELCNACGLRYARSRAKKEGNLPSSGGRRRKDKILKPRDSATPPTSTAASVAPYPTQSYGTPSSRRAYPNNNFSEDRFSTSVYSDRNTHSPSPPGSGSNATDYHHYSTSVRDIYGSSIPSPLASSSSMLSQSYQRDDGAVGTRDTLDSPVSLERSYYENGTGREPRSIDYARYAALNRRERAFEGTYKRDSAQGSRGRELVTG